MKVAILGHSFVRRLGTFCSDINESVHPEHEVSFYGKGGAKVAEILEILDELPEDIQLIYIQSGGNDINPHTSAIPIADKLLHVSQEIIRRRDIPVLIGTVFIRTNPRYQTSEEYDQVRVLINDKMKTFSQINSKIMIADHGKFFRMLKASYMHFDGVHLNRLGQLAFLYYIRRKINIATKKFYNLQGPTFRITPTIVLRENLFRFQISTPSQRPQICSPLPRSERKRPFSQDSDNSPSSKPSKHRRLTI